jgi:hypothetical protein
MSSQETFASAVRRLLADRRSERATGTRSSRRFNRTSGRLRPSAAAMRRELESFRRSQAFPYWHHDHRTE